MIMVRLGFTFLLKQSAIIDVQYTSVQEDQVFPVHTDLTDAIAVIEDGGVHRFLVLEVLISQYPARKY
jgi:hypothetical protein